MFYGREKELQKLSRRYAGEKSECVVVYGRRRVGKTALTKEFCRGKSVIYFSALNANSFDNLEELSRVISEYRLSTPEGTDCVIYPSYADAFRSVEHISSSKRIIFVIDNYQYLLKAEESVAARIWNMVKRPRDENKLFHILCGSPQCFMENRVLGYESSLHGLITVKIKLEPLTYRESALMTPGLPTERLAQIYGITGGIPHYINKLDVRGKVDTALMRNVFDTSSYLFEEPENLLKQDLREPAMYNSILTAMAHGAARLGEISSGVGIESGKCAKYLQVLLDLGIVEKETPITEKPGR